MHYSTEKTAQIICASLEKRAEVEDVKFTRLQLSANSIAKFSQRKVVDNTFIASLSSELLQHGWCMFQNAPSNYSLIQLDAAKKFRKMSAEKLLGFLNDSNHEADTN